MSFQIFCQDPGPRDVMDYVWHFRDGSDGGAGADLFEPVLSTGLISSGESVRRLAGEHRVQDTPQEENIGPLADLCRGNIELLGGHVHRSSGAPASTGIHECPHTAGLDVLLELGEIRRQLASRR